VRAALAADLFHVVQLAVKAVGDVRRRVVRARYGRHGHSGDAEYGIKGLLVQNISSNRTETRSRFTSRALISSCFTVCPSP
jgi:hypothetical protein